MQDGFLCFEAGVEREECGGNKRKKPAGYNLVSRDEFINYPMNERTQLILKENVPFSQDGKSLSLSEGLAILTARK